MSHNQRNGTLDWTGFVVYCENGAGSWRGIPSYLDNVYKFIFILKTKRLSILHHIHYILITNVLKLFEINIRIEQITYGNKKTNLILYKVYRILRKSPLNLLIET